MKLRLWQLRLSLAAGALACVAAAPPPAQTSDLATLILLCTDPEPGKPRKPIYKVPKTETPWDSVVRKMMSDYLVSMGISLDVIADMNKTPFAKMKFYDLRQRVTLKLVTGSASARSLAQGKICSSESPPPQCVKR